MQISLSLHHEVAEEEGGSDWPGVLDYRILGRYGKKIKLIPES